MITLKVIQAKSEKDKILGLIGKKDPYPFLLQTRFGIHTFGVKFPIDVIILNNEHQVMHIFEHMKPNRVFVWNPLYNMVAELPSGTIEKKKIKIGEKIKLMVE